MNDKKEYQLNVNIGGQALTLSSDVSVKHMEEVSKFVDKKYQNIRLNKRVSTNLLFSIFLGIEIADEYFIERNKLLDEIDMLNAEHEKLIAHYKKQEKAKETELLQYIEKANELDEEKDSLLEKYNKLKEEFYVLRDENISLLDELTSLQKENNDNINDSMNTFKIADIEEEIEYSEKVEGLEVLEELEVTEEPEIIEEIIEKETIDESLDEEKIEEEIVAIEVVIEVEDIKDSEQKEEIEKTEELEEIAETEEAEEKEKEIIIKENHNIQNSQPLSKKEYRKMMRKKGKK